MKEDFELSFWIKSFSEVFRCDVIYCHFPIIIFISFDFSF